MGAPQSGPDSGTQNGVLGVVSALKEGRADQLDRGSLKAQLLAGVDFRGVELVGWDFRDADLTRADLTGAKLMQCDLRGCHLVEAKLDDAELIRCDLREADLTSSTGARLNIGHANLDSATLFHADWSSAALNGSSMVGADLRAAVLEGCRLRETDLSGADFTRAQMQKADLGKSNVSGAVFFNTDLRGARLRGIQNYKKATWVGVDLRDVDFTGAYLLRRYVIDENYLFEFRNQSRVAHAVYVVWWFTSDCGRSLGRWFAFNMALALVFAVLFHFVNLDYGDHPTVFSPFYYSFVTITTLGYGDVTPASVPAQLLAVTEVILGYLGLGGLLSILANKMARRGE